MNTAEYLLRRMIEVAEEQVNAAKKIDIKALQDATERRQDLLFQLEIERESQDIQATPILQELSSELQAIDERLMAVLGTLSNAAYEAGISRRVTTYSNTGEIKRQ
jgi:phosphoribosyl-ATP pyrophosphohydrolase